MQQYHDLAKHVLANGQVRRDRTGTGTWSCFGYQNRYDLSEGFPLMTTKKLHIESIIYELLWFLKGDTNIKFLNDNGVRIWNEWANENGDLGPVYGKQWRSWQVDSQSCSCYDGPPIVIDQISNVIESIKNDPFSRRHIVSAWNVGEIDDMALPPCHLLFQFYVSTDYKLSCQLYQRSADLFLGVPFNIASYALLTHMIAHQCGLKVGEFVHTFGDVHLYENHLEQIKLQLMREPLPLPKLTFRDKPETIFDYVYEDFIIDGYNPYPAIKGKVSV